MPYKVCIIGPSGSGKGTQAEILSKKLGIPTASMGQLLRDEVAKGGELAEELDSIMRRGHQVPDDLPNKLMTDWMQEALETSGGYIVEGYPRNMVQYEYLESHEQFDCVFIITISDEEVMVRVTGRRVCPCGKMYHMKYNPPQHNETCDECGEKLMVRGDNTPEATQERIKIYHDKMTPVIKQYQEKGILHTVNGEQTIDAVHEDILTIFKRENPTPKA